MADYTNKCGSCVYFTPITKDGMVMKRGSCSYKTKQIYHDASQKACKKYKQKGAGMTNREKLEQIFPDGICPFSRNWLESEYKPSIQPKTEVLDKIRAEILEEKECAYADFERYKVEYLGQEWEDALDSLPQDDFRYGMERCIEIIDKYKAEKE